MAWERSASGSTIAGDLPPGSKETFFRLPAAARTVCLPTWVGSGEADLVHAALSQLFPIEIACWPRSLETIDARSTPAFVLTFQHAISKFAGLFGHRRSEGNPHGGEPPPHTTQARGELLRAAHADRVRRHSKCKFSRSRPVGRPVRGITHVRNTCTPPVEPAELHARQRFPDIVGCGTSTELDRGSGDHDSVQRPEKPPDSFSALCAASGSRASCIPDSSWSVKAPTLPQVVGWCGVELIRVTRRRRSSFSNLLRPPPDSRAVRPCR